MDRFHALRWLKVGLLLTVLAVPAGQRADAQQGPGAAVYQAEVSSDQAAINAERAENAAKQAEESAKAAQVSGQEVAATHDAPVSDDLASADAARVASRAAREARDAAERARDHANAAKAAQAEAKVAFNYYVTVESGLFFRTVEPATELALSIQKVAEAAARAWAADAASLDALNAALDAARRAANAAHQAEDTARHAALVAHLDAKGYGFGGSEHSRENAASTSSTGTTTTR